MNELTKMKINFGEESSGKPCLCKAVYEWERQLLSRSHLCSFVKVSARERMPSQKEQTNNQQLDPDDGTIMVMRKRQK